MILRGFPECKPDLNLLTLISKKNPPPTCTNYSPLWLSYLMKTHRPFCFADLNLDKSLFLQVRLSIQNPCYTVEMIQEHFLRAIETGLREEAVRAKLRPYLQTCNIEDDKLIAELTRVCARSQSGTLNWAGKGLRWLAWRAKGSVQAKV